MDNRNHPPALQTFTPITDATLPQHCVHANDVLNKLDKIHAFVALNHNLASALKQDCNEVEELLSQIEDIAERGPEDSRAATAALLEELEFTPALRKKIIDGMHEVFVNLHLDFQQKHNPHFIMQHYSALAAQLTAMQAQLNTILDEALTRLPPFTNEIQRVKEIEHQRNELKLSLIHLYEIVESINLEYNKIDELFDAARQEFFTFLTNIQQNEWRGALLQRLDATLLDIDDLIKQYSNHPVFKHTSLDDIIIELMREAREKTLATRETVEPEFVPPALMPARKLSFTERYPNAKNIMFGVIFGIAAAVVATLAVAAVFFTFGFGILPAGSIAMILISAAIAGGAGGVAAGIAIHNKVQSSVKPNIQSVTAQKNLSSTAGTFRKLNVNDKPELDGYDSDDEEEVVADYSNHATFAGDPPEYAPARQRLT